MKLSKPITNVRELFEHFPNCLNCDKDLTITIHCSSQERYSPIRKYRLHLNSLDSDRYIEQLYKNYHDEFELYIIERIFKKINVLPINIIKHCEECYQYHRLPFCISYVFDSKIDTVNQLSFLFMVNNFLIKWENEREVIQMQDDNAPYRKMLTKQVNNLTIEDIEKSKEEIVKSIQSKLLFL